jgi:hypothetical protein
MSYIIWGILLLGGLFFLVSFIWGICMLFQEPKKGDNNFGNGLMLGLFMGDDRDGQ